MTTKAREITFVSFCWHDWNLYQKIREGLPDDTKARSLHIPNYEENIRLGAASSLIRDETPGSPGGDRQRLLDIPACRPSSGSSGPTEEVIESIVEFDLLRWTLNDGSRTAVEWKERMRELAVVWYHYFLLQP